jgi:hypothetical protein
VTGARSVLAAFALALAPLTASAAVFMQVQGAPGHSHIPSRQGWTDLNRMSFGDARGVDRATMTKAARAAWRFSSNETVLVYGPPATAGAVLRAAAASGRPIPRVVIEVTKRAVVTDRYVLRDARIVRDAVSDARPAEKVIALTFTSLRHTAPNGGR